MRRLTVLTALVLTIPAIAMAHVSVRPRESKPGAEEKYTVRVPTEGAVATTQVFFEIPAGVTVLDVLPHEGATFETVKEGGRITSITWTKAIPPKQSAELMFTAKNPAAPGQITWKTQQRFADGTSSNWTPGTKLTDTPAAPPAPAGAQAAASQPMAPATGEAAVIEKWLAGYDAAFIAKDLDTLATFYHPDVTIYEGGGINNGWIDYRDKHLGPELKSFENLQFGHSNTKVAVLPGGQSAYATSDYFIKAKMGERELDSRGLETLVLVKGPDGTWKIRHSHTSSRPVRRPAGQ